jgi:hypothetical protein
MKLQKGTQEIKDIAHKVKEFYFGDKPVSKETWPQLIDVRIKMCQHAVTMSEYCTT